jgi:outer membrane protein assembly factor BamB
VSFFSPGAVCALERDTGRLIWRRELGKFSGASVYFYERKLFANSPHTLYSLHPDSGEIRWSFCPYGPDGEWIYSSPTIYQGNLYIGDRRGFLHCLDSNTGATIWSKRTNSDENDDVNSTPVVINGLVIVPTNAKIVVAYEAITGEDAWEQKVDGPSTYGPLLHKGLLVVVAVESVYLLDPTNGNLRQHFQWKGDSIAFAESTGRNVVIALRGVRPPKGSSEIAFLNESGVHRTASLTGHCIHFRYSAEKRLLYASHLQGVDLFSPDTGEILCKLVTTVSSGVALVDLTDDRIYVLTGDGSVHALRHPDEAS